MSTGRKWGICMYLWWRCGGHDGLMISESETVMIDAGTLDGWPRAREKKEQRKASVRIPEKKEKVGKRWYYCLMYRRRRRAIFLFFFPYQKPVHLHHRRQQPHQGDANAHGRPGACGPWRERRIHIGQGRVMRAKGAALTAMKLSWGLPNEVGGVGGASVLYDAVAAGSLPGAGHVAAVGEMTACPVSRWTRMRTAKGSDELAAVEMRRV